MPEVNQRATFPAYTVSMTSTQAPPAPTLSVSQLNRQVRGLLEGHFDFVWVEGEISNLARPSSGHWYFSLKDDKAQVRCAMFRNRNQRLRISPANGDAVRVRARVSLYEGRGEFQLIAEHMEPAGDGALQLAFEALKAKLLAEGLFAADRKQPIPTAVTRLAVITSPTGAAIKDITSVLERRSPGIEVYILPVAVQGEQSAPEIVAALARANRLAASGDYPFDAIILARGGGSLEDLWSFNTEPVARAIAASELPVVSAVGHEVDFTIADMVADQRAPTPSAAAELVSPDREEQLRHLHQLRQRLERQIRQVLEQARWRLTALQRQLQHPGHRLREQSQRLDELERRLLSAQRASLQHHRSRLALLQTRLLSQSPQRRLTGEQDRLRAYEERLQQAMKARLQAAGQQLGHLAQLLDNLSPLRVLDRGYALLTDEQGSVVTDSTSVTTGSTLRARLARGELEVEVRGQHPASD